MKKYLYFLLIMLLCLCGCNSKKEELVLRIYNWQDYIDEGLDDDGQKEAPSVMDDWCSWYYDTYGVEVTYVYDTFETNEVMLNNLKTGKTSYDLVCPSEYAIQRMIRLNMLEEYDYDLKDINNDKIMTNYDNISPYLKDLFDNANWTKFAVPYMWGTMGYIYNPELVDEEAMESWSALWNSEYKNVASAKDSVRDTYVVGVMYVYRDELLEILEKYQNNEITEEVYTQTIEEIMNRCDDKTIEKVGEALKEMKNNLYGFEVDSGKNDIVTGKIGINFAWSGDAVYSMDVAEEEEGLELAYSVPKEGSNVWFDGWVMLKGANKELAQSFVNYLCDPEIAVRNMNVIGYTSSVVGDAIADMIYDWYGQSEDLEETYEVDLSYLFGDSLSSEYLTDGKAIFDISIYNKNRQFDAQYPTYDVIIRCGIMRDFGDQNDKVLAMWENVKIGDIPIWITIALVSVLLSSVVLIYGIRTYKIKQRKKRRLQYINE